MFFVFISFLVYNLSLFFFVINEEFLLLLLVLFVLNVLFFLLKNDGNSFFKFDMFYKLKNFVVFFLYNIIFKTIK